MCLVETAKALSRLSNSGWLCFVPQHATENHELMRLIPSGWLPERRLCIDGTETKPQINRDAVRLVKELCGIDMSMQYSKTIDEIPSPDIVISMGCDVGCPFLGREFDENWGLPDPTGNSKEVFVQTIKEIEKKVKAL